MRKNPHSIHHLIWLVNTILSAGEAGIRRTDIADKWRAHIGEPDKDYPPRTFINHKEDIREVFGLNICCRAVGKGADREYYYYIENPEDLSTSRAQGWLINTFSLKNILDESSSVKDSISLEDIPKGQQLMPVVISAVKEMRKVYIHYTKYSGEGKSVCVEPYGLKVFKQRWYLVGKIADKSRDDGFRIYSLDRIDSIEVTDEKFSKDADWSIDEHFASNIGIWTSQEKACRVIIRANSLAAKYLADLPLHSSQEIVSEDGGYAVLSYWLKVTPDLVQELFRFRENIEVLEPPRLRRMMADTVVAMSKMYKDMIS